MLPKSDNPGRETTENLAIPFPVIVFLEAALALFALLLGAILGRNPLSDFVWSTRGAVEGLVATLPLIGLLWISNRWPTRPMVRIQEFLTRELLPHLQGASRLDFAMLALAAGVGEEMLFRGVIQGLVGAKVGVVGGLLLTSILFGFSHPATTAYVVIAAFLGGYLGLVWILSGNLLAPIVTHAVYDFVALIVITSANRNDPAGSTG